MAQVAYLKTEHKTGHGHANALVAHLNSIPHANRIAA